MVSIASATPSKAIYTLNHVDTLPLCGLDRQLVAPLVLEMAGVSGRPPELYLMLLAQVEEPPPRSGLTPHFRLLRIQTLPAQTLGPT